MECVEEDTTAGSWFVPGKQNGHVLINYFAMTNDCQPSHARRKRFFATKMAGRFDRLRPTLSVTCPGTFPRATKSGNHLGSATASMMTAAKPSVSVCSSNSNP
eukprot:TRINITY_DN12507_c0_g2_i1.p1 TRINITY_DN12507_c0_g2~~TRINITY_DN12507_c0_g2_i1.p1  ORF type:complete len:103 (-),score=4.58 TRINITY_DN12507_c0_g2_i1:41-349(-)